MGFSEVAALKYSTEFIFGKVLEKKNLQLRLDLPIPPVYFESKTPLAHFQDAIKEQFGFAPDVFLNAYSAKNNEIFLVDDLNYYQSMKRCMDDSLAHELTHYVQFKYQNFDMNDESLESDAVAVQTWFRETFCQLQ